MSPDAREQAVMGLDPWGLRRIEKLLAGLDGVGSLKIVPDGQGGIDEIHVLSTSDLSPKQIVRNIESALLAEFGLQVDHRKISIARLKGAEIPSIAEAAAREEAAVEASRTGRRFLLDGFHIERKAGQNVTCRAKLRSGEAEHAGEAEGPDYPRSRLEVAVNAVLEALRGALGEGATLSLEGVTRSENLGRSMVLVVLNGHAGRNTVFLAGVARVHDSPEEAAVLASLHAANRWVDNK